MEVLMNTDFPLPSKFLKIRSDLTQFMALAHREGISSAIKNGKATIFYRLCAWEGRRFDSKYQLETSQPLRLQNLTVAADNVIGYEYVGTSPWITRTAIGLLPKRLEQYVFVDIGCGKGRIVLVAAERGFLKVIGVDIAAELVEMARDNVGRFRQLTGCRTPIEIVQADATKFVWPPDNCVFSYFAAPSDDGGVLRMALENAHQSYERNPRDMYLILVNNHQEDFLRRFPFLEKVASGLSPSAWIAGMLFSLNVYRFK
jgi:SAM-dependent methyltransferase